MTDKDKIKQEIKRRIDLYSIAEKDDTTFARMGELSSLMDFIHSLPEEPASEDLEEEIERCWKEMFPTGWSDYTLLTLTYEQHRAFAHHYAEWQKQKDQETIELAEDHAMLAGMNKMKEEMMKDAVEGTVKYEIGSAEISQCDRRYQVLSDPTPITNAKLSDKVKIIILKTE